MKVRVTVMPKATVLDPQGVAIRNTLRQLGLPGAASVRAGKVLDIEFEPGAAPPEAVRTQLDLLCRDFLSNPVIEDYRLEILA